MALGLHAHHADLAWRDVKQGLRTAGILIVAILLIAVVALVVGVSEQYRTFIPGP